MDIEKTYGVPFSPERVFAAWVSSETVIAPATAMDIDPRVGGHYRLIMESEAFTARTEGIFLAFDDGKHLRYTWEWNRDGEVTEIDVTFLPIDAGTRIEIRHSGFTKEEIAGAHDAGWDSYIEGLVNFLNST